MRQGDRNNLLRGKRYAAFGYNNLVSDMRSLAIMRETGCLIAFGAAPFGTVSGWAAHAVRRRARVRARGGSRVTKRNSLIEPVLMNGGVADMNLFIVQGINKS